MKLMLIHKNSKAKKAMVKKGQIFPMEEQFIQSFFQFFFSFFFLLFEQITHLHIELSKS